MTRAGAADPKDRQRSQGRPRRPQRQRQDHADEDGSRAPRPHRRLGADRPPRGRQSGGSPAVVVAQRLADVLRRPFVVGAPRVRRPTSRGHGLAARAERLLDRSASRHRDDIPTTFSRGLRQKAAITLAFIRPFKLLLVDEPFVGLDEPGKQALLALFDSASHNAARRL